MQEKAPLFPLIHSVYSAPSSLFVQDSIIRSAEGIQQGEPLGPLLFSFASTDLVELLKSEMYIFYLDNGTLGGKFSEVHNDLETVVGEAEVLGLQLNHLKSEIISRDKEAMSAMLEVAPDLCPVSPENAQRMPAIWERLRHWRPWVAGSATFVHTMPTASCTTC